MQKQEGSIMLIVLLMIVLLSVFTLMMAALTIHEIQMTDYSQKHYQAAYNAQAALEEAAVLFERKEGAVTTEELAAIQGSFNKQGEYEMIEVEIIEESKVYLVASGSCGQVIEELSRLIILE